LIGYAGVFAAHISDHWPGLSNGLAELIAAAAARGEECKIPSMVNESSPLSLADSLRWRPSAFRQRAIGVCDSGWTGLKSPQAVAHTVEFLHRSAEAEMAGGLRTQNDDDEAAGIDARSCVRREAHAARADAKLI
jgi:hypothetical protein